MSNKSNKKELAHKAAMLLYSRGARHVWLLGSLAMGYAVDNHSDIDLAVDGLPAQLFVRTRRELNQMCGCKVDLVEMEAATPPMRHYILQVRVLVPRED